MVSPEVEVTDAISAVKNKLRWSAGNQAFYEGRVKSDSIPFYVSSSRGELFACSCIKEVDTGFTEHLE